MTVGENVLLNTMKLDKTVNQRKRPFIPKERGWRGEKLIVPMRKMQKRIKYQLAKIDPN